MKKPALLFTVLVIPFLLSCSAVPSFTPTVVPGSTASVQPSPSATPSPFPTAIPTQTIDPEIQKRFAGAEAFLPADGQPLYNFGWFRGADEGTVSAGFLPYVRDGGQSLLIIARPREEDASTQTEPVRIWDWQDTGLQPKTWEEILPMDTGDSRGLSSFLGRDENGQWWAVISSIDWDGPELVLFGVFPIVNRDDVQIEPVSLLPIEENQPVTQFLVHTNGRLALYDATDNNPREVWSTDRVISGGFHVHSYASHGGSVDVTGDGRQDLLIVWNATLPRLIDAYQFTADASDMLHWLGRLDSSLQYTDVTGDGVADLLKPDNPENPTQWQVITLNGDIFQESNILSQPQPISPVATVVTSAENLPRLPSDIVFQRRGKQEWWRWSGSGVLEELTQPPGHLDDACSPQMYGGYGNACYSPVGRYQLINMPSGIEGSYTGILDGISGNKVRIPGSFVYSEGYLTFGWSPDESFLILAQGEGLAKLSKVDPVSGDTNTLFDYSLCGVDRLHCQHFSVDAVTDPVVFDDGSLGFAIQSFDRSLYPPPGIYRMFPDSELTMLTALPFIDDSKGSLEDLSPHSLIYGHLLWSPDKSMFLFYDLFVGNKTGVRTLLLGKADGSALWDLREVFPDVYEFRWD